MPDLEHRFDEMLDRLEADRTRNSAVVAASAANRGDGHRAGVGLSYWRWCRQWMVMHCHYRQQ